MTELPLSLRLAQDFEPKPQAGQSRIPAAASGRGGSESQILSDSKSHRDSASELQALQTAATVDSVTVSTEQWSL